MCIDQLWPTCPTVSICNEAKIVYRSNKVQQSLRFHCHLGFHRGHWPPQIPFVSAQFENLQDPRRPNENRNLRYLGLKCVLSYWDRLCLCEVHLRRPFWQSVSTNFCMTCAVLLSSTLLHTCNAIHDAPCLRTKLRQVENPNKLADKKQRWWNWSEILKWLFLMFPPLSLSNPEI